MVDFRHTVAAIMAGTARAVIKIPQVDGDGRPTLARGMRGDLVKLIQAKLNIDADGIFGPLTEAAVRQFQRDFRTASLVRGHGPRLKQSWA
jgi:peptidoglycan hydrolase-like protein with peptidoglycan-binding domain